MKTTDILQGCADKCDGKKSLRFKLESVALGLISDKRKTMDGCMLVL